MIYLPLFSGIQKHIKLIHKRGTYQSKVKYEPVVTLGYDNMIKVYVIDTELFQVRQRFSVPYYFKLMQNIDSELRPIIELIDGFWYMQDSEIKLTLFVFARIRGYSFTIAQIDYDNILDLSPDISHFRVWHEFEKTEKFVAGLLMKENLVFNDYKTVDAIDTYIMYVDYSNHTLDDKWVQGYHVLVSDAEKQDFASKHPEIEVDPKYPYINFVDKPTVLYKLPSKSEKIQFQFTSGLLYVRFTEPDSIEYERFKI